MTITAVAVGLSLLWSRCSAAGCGAGGRASAAVLIPVCGGAWIARQNHFGGVQSAEAAHASTLPKRPTYCDDIVMAVNIKGAAVAYPILQLGYHHIVNDVVSGEPIVATY
jgi:hypothetical protein